MESSEKVLFISYFFPPIGGGGVIRTLKFVKYLPKFGYKPYVLTVKEGFYPIQDKTLLEEIPKEVEVIRVNYFEPANWFKMGFWKSLFAYIIYPFFLIPDRQILWFFPALKEASKIIKKENIKLIFTSSAPNSDHLIGYFLKKHYQIKWVADFRDEWANNPLKKFPTPLHRWLNKYWEKKVVKSADRVISVSEPITEYLRSIQSQEKKFMTITNGFDGQDFEGKNPKVFSKKFTIMFSGSVYDLKIIEPFLDAIKELDLKNLKVEFVGINKRVSHKDAVKKLFSANVLLLILSPIDRPGVITGKLFEYFAAKKPILALAPANTEAAKLIEKFKLGEIVHPYDKAGINKAVKKMYKLWQESHLKVPEINYDQYSRENLTKELAAVFFSVQNPIRKIKLCLIGNIQSPQIRNLIDFLRNKNYEITIISTQKGETKGAKSFWLGRPGLTSCSTACYFFRSILKIRVLIKKINPDIVHGQDLVFAGIWAYLSGFHPFVVTPWGSDVMNYKKFIFFEKNLIQRTLQNADLVTVSSKALRDKSENIFPIKSKAHLIRFGINLDIFKKKTSIKNQVIFCPRSIAPIYNTDVLIRAFASIAKKNKNVTLALLDNVADENYALEIEKLIIKLGLVEKVQFWPKVPNQKMANYYNQAEVVTTLTSSDGCSVSFLEAMASECKIVATNLPYIKEWFHKKNIWLVGVGDIKATATAILAALKFSDAKWRKIGQANRKLIAQKAEIKDNFEKLDKLYKDLI